MASALPLDTELEAKACGGALSEDTIDRVLRTGASRQRPGIIIRVSGVAHTTNHITYTAANGQADLLVLG